MHGRVSWSRAAACYASVRLFQLAENTVVADRFRLVRMIGKGGMGSVWQAVHIGLDTPCALKFIEGELVKVAEAHERFEREAKVSAQLRSPHIVQIIDHGVWQGRPYIAMELLEGTDLGKFIRDAGGKIPLPVLNDIVQQLCRALTKAHNAGVIHRDLKPDNIFIVPDDDRRLVKILDFGVAKSTGQAIENSNTKTGSMLGTPYYMSPEQAQGVKTIDARSDLWSVAVIVYQCLVGRLPFESEALGDLLVKIIVQAIPVPSQKANVPPGFDAWWAKAADRNPDNRFQTAKELAAALEPALQLTPSPNPRDSQPFMTTAMMNGPSAPGSSPSGGVGPGPMPMPTPPGQLAPPMPTPHPHMQSGGYAPANPATFSGAETPMTVPKKGAPIAVFAVIGVLLLVGIAGAGIAVTKTRTAAGGAPSASVVATVATPVPTPTVEKTAEIPAPEPIASAEPAAPAASASAEPAEPTAKAAPTHTAVAQAPGNPTTAAPPTPAPVPSPKAAPTGSAKKKWDPGF